MQRYKRLEVFIHIETLKQRVVGLCVCGLLVAYLCNLKPHPTPRKHATAKYFLARTLKL